MFFFRKKTWNLAKVTPPWGAEPSIYEYLASHVIPGNAKLSERGQELPDTQKKEGSAGGIRWAAGGLDRSFGHHLGATDDDRAEKAAKALRKALDEGTSEAIAAFYRAFDAGAIGSLDAFLEMVAAFAGPYSSKLHELALWIATRGADREPVKAAIALLGYFPGEGDSGVLTTLALHDEFTLYAAVAFCNKLDDPTEALWEMAKRVDGWGRIQCIERLATSSDPRIKEWLLLEGYENSVIHAYTAAICARAGDLRGALAAPKISPTLMKAACELLTTLMEGSGPADGIDEYKEGAEATRHLARHLRADASTLDHLMAASALRAFIDADGPWSERAARGWTDALREEVRTHCNAVLADGKWRPLVEEGLRFDDDAIFDQARLVAESQGIDSWERLYARAREGKGWGTWYQLTATPDLDRLRRALALAEEILPLAEIASGPMDEIGLGLEFRHHGNLEFVLQQLPRLPGEGWALIAAGLRSPVVRGRNMALRAVAAWDVSKRPPEVNQALRDALQFEPTEDAKKNLQAVLDGRPLGE